MNDQPELLEQFLQALRQDRHAVPPAGLDPDIAEFARRMVQQTSIPTTRARERMWEQALAKSRSTANENGHYNHVNYKELDKMAVITARPIQNEANGARFSLTLMAAAVAAVLCITVFMMFPKGSPDQPSLIAGAPDVQQDVTATPVPSLVFTETPTPVAAEQIMATATPVPADLSTIQIDPSAGTIADVSTTYIFGTLIYFEDALSLMGIDADSVLNVEIIYRVTLTDGSVANMHIIPIPEGVASSEIIRAQFPDATTYGSDPISYRGQTFVVTPLNNGVLVLVDPTSQRLMYMTHNNDGTVPSMGQPTALPPSAGGGFLAATPTLVLPAPGDVITATPLLTSTPTPLAP